MANGLTGAGLNGVAVGHGQRGGRSPAELFAAVRGDDLARARALNDRLHPLAEMFYAEPFIDMHNRMKEALVLLGRLEHAFVRPPLVKLEAAEIARIAAALEAAGFTLRRKR